jgi:hypothetical protein
LGPDIKAGFAAVLNLAWHICTQASSSIWIISKGKVGPVLN